MGYKEIDDKVPIYTILSRQFPDAIIQVCKRAEQGHQKYKEYDEDYLNYKRIELNEQSQSTTNNDRIEVYTNALTRHLFEIGEDSTLEHYSAVAWNALARLQLYLDTIHTTIPSTVNNTDNQLSYTIC